MHTSSRMSACNTLIIPICVDIHSHAFLLFRLPVCLFPSAVLLCCQKLHDQHVSKQMWPLKLPQGKKLQLFCIEYCCKKKLLSDIRHDFLDVGRTACSPAAVSDDFLPAQENKQTLFSSTKKTKIIVRSHETSVNYEFSLQS